MDTEGSYEGSMEEVMEKVDPWRDRTSGMICKRCMYHAPKHGNVGRCRRHAPTITGYPVVYDTDWCGDFKLDEYAA